MGLFDTIRRSYGFPRPVGYKPILGTLTEWAKKDHSHNIFVENWTKLELFNGWTHSAAPNEDSLRVLVDPMGFVHIEGTILPGNTAAGTHLTTLPSRFRATQVTLGKAFVLQVTGAAGGLGSVLLGNDGKIYINAAGPAWAGATSVSFNCIFEVDRDVPDAQ